ncbi:MAG: hypothetical protein KUG78_01980 [Kangiellaceae bacterium]|nr:hypothetical protein [Kangiellaceae bacterium]
MRHILGTLILTLVIFLLGSESVLAEEKRITIHMVGDSTMATKSDPINNPEYGWGQVFSWYFTNQVNIVNHAINGRSSKSFIDEGRWRQVQHQLNQGDYVFIQFGHNDQKKNDPTRFSQASTSYKNNLAKMLTDVRKANAVPVLLSSIVRRKFNDKGVLVDTHGQYPSSMKELADELQISYIDLNNTSKHLVQSLGDNLSKNLFLWLEKDESIFHPDGAKDNTHLNRNGALAIARLVVDDIKANKLIPMTYLLSAEQLDRIQESELKKTLFHSVVYKTEKQLVKLDGYSKQPIYNSLSEAIKAAPKNSLDKFTIKILPGIYHEKMKIDKPNIQLLGSGREYTIIEYDDSAGSFVKGTQKPMGTTKSASLTISAANFSAFELTIKNSFDYLSNDILAKSDPNKTRGQAVSLLLNEDSDRAYFRDVSIIGFQDTLFVNSGLSLFENSEISGNVDFIFGAGQAILLNSKIVTQPRNNLSSNISYISAPSTDISQNFGFVFINCRLEKYSDVAENSVYLGRPWHPTTTFSDGRYADPKAIGSSVFINTWMDDHIKAKAWFAMRGTSRDGSKNTWFQPEDSRFYEFVSSGPGRFNRIKLKLRDGLPDQSASDFNIDQLLNGWEIPSL